MRTVVVGAGAIGGVIGGRLFQHGHEVVLVARGAHGEAMRAGGMLLRDPDDEVVLPIPTQLEPAAVDWRDDDTVVVATKTQDAGAVLDALAATAPPSVHIVCATNGVETERLALRRFARVSGMCVMMPGAHLEPGIVEAYSTPVTGILDLGRVPSGHDEADGAVADSLEASTFSSRPVDDVLRVKRAKLLMNLGNVLEAACGPDGRGGEIWNAARAEAEASFTAAGLDWATDEEDKARRAGLLTMRPIRGARRGGGSTWQSLARGTGATEVDYLNGEIVLVGRLHGVPTPVNAALQRLAIELATTGAPPASRTYEQLLVATGLG